MMRLATLLMMCAIPTAALAVDIPGDPSSCGVRITRGNPGVLQGDLDCTGRTDVAGVVLGSGAELRLNGHTIRNARVAVECEVARSPARTCSIVGPGELTASKFGVFTSERLRIEDVDIHGNEIGIHNPYGTVDHANRVQLTGVVIRDHTGDGIKGGGKLIATDTTIRNNGGVGTTTYGASRLVRTTITGNGSVGIITGEWQNVSPGCCYSYGKGQLAFVDSTITGNGLVDGADDIVSKRKPKLKRTTCGTSSNPTEPGNPTWGVCAND